MVKRINFEEKNGMWKGNSASKESARERARLRFPKKPCEICGNPRSEIHHIDDNPLNNSIDNIKHFCRRHHMEFDGRLEKMRWYNTSKRINVDLNKFMEVYDLQLTEKKMAEVLGFTVKVVKNRKRELGLKNNGPYRNRKQFCGGVL